MASIRSVGLGQDKRCLRKIFKTACPVWSQDVGVEFISFGYGCPSALQVYPNSKTAGKGPLEQLAQRQIIVLTD